ncbi:MAG: phosphotransferase [Myxococcota bacterium]
MAAGLLTRDQVHSILSLYYLEGPDAFGHLLDHGGHADGTGRNTYWVRVDGLEYVLRLVHRKTVDDMLHEKELLLHVERAGMTIPRLMQNVARGSFTPWARRGRFVSLFRYPPGRGLGRFEIRPHHAEAVGAWLARFHLAARDFPRRRKLTGAFDELEKGLERAERALERHRLARRHRRGVQVIRHHLEQVRLVEQFPVSMGILHGGLGLSAVRFLQNELTGAADLDAAGYGPWLRDLAYMVQEWCWRPEVAQHGGPAGAYDPDLVVASMAGYHGVRPLTSEEQRLFPRFVQLASVREATCRLLDNELKRRPRRHHPYRDYRHYVARLEASCPAVRRLQSRPASLVRTHQGS